MQLERGGKGGEKTNNAAGSKAAVRVPGRLRLIGLSSVASGFFIPSYDLFVSQCQPCPLCKDLSRLVLVCSSGGISEAGFSGQQRLEVIRGAATDPLLIQPVQLQPAQLLPVQLQPVQLQPVHICRRPPVQHTHHRFDHILEATFCPTSTKYPPKIL